MNYEVGGYLLFPSIQTYTDLIPLVLQAMELTPADVEVSLPREGYAFPPKTDLPVEQALVELGQRGGGIDVTIDERPETYWLEPAAGPYTLPDLWLDGEAWLHPPIGLYPVINIWVTNHAMSTRYQSQTTIDHYAERWLRLCEQGNAVYGYFSPFEHMTQREFLDRSIFPHMQAENLSKLLDDSAANWLVYFGPELARRWRQEQIPWPTSWSSPQPFLSLALPSGAQFIRTSEEVFGEEVPDYNA
jgi:hypothetical protein